MANERYNLVFRGDIVLGHKIADVKLRLGKLFKVNDAQLERLFSGRPVVIKKSLPKAEADRYTEALQQAGAQVEIQAINKATATPIEQATAKKKKPLAERLAEQAAAGDMQGASGAAAFAPKNIPVPVVEESEPEEEGLVLAPVGSILLADQYREDEPVPDIQPVETDLRPMQGNLLDAEEMKKEVPPIGVDLSGISLAEPGEDLLDEAHKPLPVPEVDAPDIDLAPVGSDLGEKKIEAAPLNFDLSDIQLMER
ncbi:hypothetical protein [Pseudoteredinibacter isoporae]|uniref:Ribosomal protein L7/L12 C-terminal domain-containing protein n=1 Tax=Pseudoteredinibacter isoporae TaxID=570281 RepID=A0A7X0JWU4_9GAMM|nr:hypothetical protein [Pseudoteredinibacter isoporae]MBB6522970.1 hypothetical protein [Pseudoteredinibacter isoporae]NHO88494.1 hypothetical protein [Pseudoteredinibacter isoporae]NIB22107.1 hypothetical protein [Pseudoteredinibacter isoporae]